MWKKGLCSVRLCQYCMYGVQTVSSEDAAERGHIIYGTPGSVTITYGRCVCVAF